ncbi:MAG: glycerate kinase [Akkermansiaceae bacterium]
MNILLAPDKFKGSLTAEQVCSIIERGIRSVIPDANIVSCPIADGGDGFADLLCDRLGGEWIECPAHDALDRPITARYALCGEAAVMEMSEASGIRLIEEELKDIWNANTCGTGEMMRHAVEESKVKRIILGIGGSVTNDAGCGMASALGVRFFDAHGGEIKPTPKALASCARVDVSDRIDLPEIHVACDVENPLLGLDGATRVYGPQKGAREEDMEKLEAVLEHLARLTNGLEESVVPGAGAAGGLGFGLIKFCDAELMSGFDLVAREINLLEKITAADVVVTGEGKLDSQTLQGKGPAGVALLARDAGKKIAAIAGIIEEPAKPFFDHTYALHDESRPLDETIRRGEELLEASAAEMARDLQNHQQ